MDPRTPEAAKLLCGNAQAWLANPWGSAGELGAKYLKPIIERENTIHIDTSIPFGKAMKAHFRVGQQWHYLNHGSYGAVLRVVHDYQRKLEDLIDENPNAFFDDTLGFAIRRAAADLASFINCEPDNVALVPNATTAMTTVMRSLSFTQNDTIILTNFTYGAVKKQVHFVGQQSGPRFVIVDLMGALDDTAEMVKRFEAAVTAHPGASLAILDHIISETATVMPIKELIPLFKKRGIRVLIDGAHAIGQIPVDIRALGDVDFYCSNAHKWLCAALGCAFLYVNPKHQSIIHPLTLSHGYSFGFLQEFGWTGSNSYLAFLALPMSLRFFRAYHPDKISAYCNQLARKVAANCVAKWGTALLCDVSQFASMISVRLPPFTAPVNSGELRKVLRRNYMIEIPIIQIGAHLYARISAQIYMEESDYDIFIDTILLLSRLAALPAEQ